MLLVDSQPFEPKSLVERKVKTATTRPAPGPTVSTTPGSPTTPGNDGEETPSGQVNDAAAVLTAVDEDEEGAEEAQLPEEFEYHSEGEDEPNAD